MDHHVLYILGAHGDLARTRRVSWPCAVAPPNGWLTPTAAYFLLLSGTGGVFFIQRNQSALYEHSLLQVHCIKVGSAIDAAVLVQQAVTATGHYGLR